MRSVFTSLLILLVVVGACQGWIHTISTSFPTTYHHHHHHHESHVAQAPLQSSSRRIFGIRPPYFTKTKTLTTSSTQLQVSSSSPEPPPKDLSQSSLSPPSQDTTREEEITAALSQDFAVQAILICVSLFVAYTVGTTLVTAVGDAASTVAGALRTELWKELEHMAQMCLSLIVALIRALWETSKVALPALYHIGAKGVEVATPIVQQAANAASPFVAEATTQMTQAAAPYVDQVHTAIDQSITTPLSQAVDANIVTPLQQVSGSVTQAIDTTLQDATHQMSQMVSDTPIITKPFDEVQKGMMGTPLHNSVGVGGGGGGATADSVSGSSLETTFQQVQQGLH